MFGMPHSVFLEARQLRYFGPSFIVPAFARFDASFATCCAAFTLSGSDYVLSTGIVKRAFETKGTLVLLLPECRKQKSTCRQRAHARQTTGALTSRTEYC